MLQVGDREVRVSSPGRVLWPDLGITKLDLARYLATVGDAFVRANGGRPVSLQRFPAGVDGDDPDATAAQPYRPERPGEGAFAPTVPGSLSAFPFSLLCFPDLYAPSLIVHAWPLNGPWGSFPMIAVPPAFSGKVLYQALGFGGSGFELSTPAVIDVN